MHEILLTYDEIKDSRQGSSSHFFCRTKEKCRKEISKELKGEKMKNGVLHMANRGTDSIIS
jgi:hypothetical protein